VRNASFYEKSGAKETNFTVNSPLTPPPTAITPINSQVSVNPKLEYNNNQMRNKEVMNTRHGYISDNLERLSLKDIEATLIDLDHDNYINDWERRDLQCDYMQERWYRLQYSFEYTDENVRKLGEANELIKMSAERLARKAWRIYQAEKKSLKEHPRKNFNRVDLKCHLFVPRCYETDNEERPLVEGDVDETLWNTLVSYWRLERCSGAMLSGYLYSHDEYCKTEDDFVSDVLWGSTCDEDPKRRSWGHDCLMDRKATDNICFVWPFHSLVSHEYVSLCDLIKIRGYKEAITVEYGKDDDKND